MLRGSVNLLAAGVIACQAACSSKESVDGQLRRHVEALASPRLQGRLAGTPGYDSAAAYAARELRRAGVDAVAASGGRRTYYQTVRMVRERIDSGTALEIRTAAGRSRLPSGRRTFLLLSPGDSSPAPVARPPIFVGSSLHAPEHGIDDLAGLDLAGRAVLVTALPPRGPELARLPEVVARMYAERAAAQRRRFGDLVQRGAAALLLLPDRWLVDEWDVISAIQGQLHYRSAEPLPGWEPDPPVPVALLHADLVDRLFVNRDYHPISHAGRYHTFVLDDVALRLLVQAHPDTFAAANVIGLVPGREASLRDEYIVVSAQLDGEEVDAEGRALRTQSAAACAAVLEAAAATASSHPGRSVLFVLFTAEAGGRWGSRYFVSRPPLRGRMAAAIDVGPVGVVVKGSPRLAAYAASPLLPLVRAAAHHGGRDLWTMAGTPSAFKGTGAASFQEAGVPVVLLTAGSEVASRGSRAPGPLDWGQLRAATSLLQAVIAQLADARSLPGPGGGRTRQ